MSFQQRFTEDRRLQILYVLAKASDYTANEYMLQQLVAGRGHSVSRDALRVDLAWLEEQGLIKVEINSTTHVARLLNRGVDVAAGRATVPGVKRPLPGDA